MCAYVLENVVILHNYVLKTCRPVLCPGTHNQRYIVQEVLKKIIRRTATSKQALSKEQYTEIDIRDSKKIRNLAKGFK